MKVHATTDGHRIAVSFPWNQDYVQAMRDFRGSKWDRDGRVWSVALSKPNVERLVKIFGDELDMSPMLGAWIADRSIVERVSWLEEQVAFLMKKAENGSS